MRLVTVNTTNKVNRNLKIYLRETILYKLYFK